MKMFQTATLKLTGWYLLIIMFVSLLFSLIVYQSASSELSARLEQFGQGLHSELLLEPSFNLLELRTTQAEEASHNILINLAYINVLVLLAGGVASYAMARRTLRPIEESHAAQSRFVSDASHEFRTPLAAMRTELEVGLKAKNLTKKEMKELLTSNLEEVDKLTRLSSTLLSLSKMDYASLKHERLSLTNLVQTSVNRYQKRTGRIKLKMRAKQLVVDAHQPSIEELLTILMDNALKYSPANSTVDVKLIKRSGKARFQIANDGKGISAADLPHIFDRFYQADNARTRSESSSFGLGLSLAKKIVELHGGELSVSSAINKKTTFTFELPITERNNKITSILRKPSAK